MSDRDNVRSVLAGGPLTAKAVAALTGLELAPARVVLSQLAHRGEVASEKAPGKPRVYTLIATGPLKPRKPPIGRPRKPTPPTDCLLAKVWQ